MSASARAEFFLIDTYGFIFRAYHARARMGAPPMRTTTGLSTEAVFIFNNMLRKLSRPSSRSTWRPSSKAWARRIARTEFAEYKANRSGNAAGSDRPDSLCASA